MFYQAAYEWDEFKAFDYRIALHGGLGFEVFKFDDRFLKLRFGAGASREVGGTVDEWLPELQFGGDWERQLTDTLKLYANVDYYPNVEDFADYRLNVLSGLEFVIDAERNINFRMFASTGMTVPPRLAMWKTIWIMAWRSWSGFNDWKPINVAAGCNFAVYG